MGNLQIISTEISKAEKTNESGLTISRPIIKDRRYNRESVQESLNYNHSKNTQTGYKSYWKMYLLFAGQRDPKEKLTGKRAELWEMVKNEEPFDFLVINHTHITHFIDCLKQVGYKISAIRFAIAAIKGTIAILDTDTINENRKANNVQEFNSENFFDAIDHRQVRKQLSGEGKRQKDEAKDNKVEQIKKAPSFTNAEFRKVLKWCDESEEKNNDRATFRKMYLTLLYQGGARVSEVLNAKVEDFTIEENENGEFVQWRIPESKTSDKPTFKVLPYREDRNNEKQAYDLILEFVKGNDLKYNDHLICASYNKGGRVSIRRDDKGRAKRLSHTAIHKDFKKIFAQALTDGERFSLHSPRRSFINNMSKKGTKSSGKWTIDQIASQTLQSPAIIQKAYFEDDRNLDNNPFANGARW